VAHAAITPGAKAPVGEAGHPAQQVCPTWLVAAVVAVGLALRGWILASPLGRLDSDEAVVGLMARHILDGELNAFFWGQTYGGTLDQFLTAGVFALVGPSVFALKAVQVALAGLACVLTWRVGRRIIGEGPARLAGLLFWIAPVAYLVYSTKSRGWYWVGLCLALGVVLVGLRLLDRPRWQEMAWLGLLVGLAWWTSPALLLLIGPAGAYLLVRRPALLRLLWAAVPPFLVGAAPWIRYNLVNDFASLVQPGAPEASTYLERLAGFFTTGLPLALGARSPYVQTWIGGAAGLSLYLAALLGFAFLLIRRRRALAPLLILALAYPLLFAVSESTVYVAEPRYLLFLAPVLVLLVASALATHGRQLGGLTLALVFSLVGLGTLSSWSDRQPPQTALAPGDLAPVLAVLERHDVSAAWAGYWTSYRLGFESNEDVTAASLGQVRYRPFQVEVAHHPAPAFVVERGGPEDVRLGPALAREGASHDREAAGSFAVYLPDRAVDPARLADVWSA
jgi:4-amino-4-deoxy-L-arabinose transferase-like glycosyltransferase